MQRCRVKKRNGSLLLRPFIWQPGLARRRAGLLWKHFIEEAAEPRKTEQKYTERSLLLGKINAGRRVSDPQSPARPGPACLYVLGLLLLCRDGICVPPPWVGSWGMRDGACPGFGQLADIPGECVQACLIVVLPKDLGQSRETTAKRSQPW